MTAKFFFLNQKTVSYNTRGTVCPIIFLYKIQMFSFPVLGLFSIFKPILSE